MSNDTTQSTHRSASRFLSGTLISRITGMLRDMAMAFAFGTESALAAFMVAFRFAHLARRLFGEGSLQNTFIPHFEDLRKSDPRRAFALFRDLSASLLIILSLVVITVMGVLAFLLFQYEWSSNTRHILWFTFIMLPSLIFICLYGLNAALLGCEKSYFTAGIAPVAFNLVWILAALCFAKLPTTLAMTLLSIAVIIGCIAQWAVTIPRTRQILPSSLPSLSPFSSDVKTLIKPLLIANFGVAASQINNAIDPLFALFTNSEGPAWLWYAIRVQQLPLALFGIALSSALVPPISRAIKRGHIEQFHHFFQNAHQKTVCLTLLITTGIFATAPSCINLLFGRGHFSLESVQGTSECLLGYGIGLFPMAYVLIAAPALFALGDYQTPTRGALIAMLLNISLNALFIFVFDFGTASVAIATSLSAFCNAYFLSRALKIKATWGISFGKTVVVSAVSLAAVFIADYALLGQIPSIQVMKGIPLELSQSPIDQMTLLTLEGVAFFVAAGITAYILKVKELYPSSR